MSVFPELLPDLNEKITHNYRGMRYSLEYAQNVSNSSPHRHNFLEFTYVTKGYGTETINGVKHIMQPGTFTVLLPYHVHEIYSSTENPLSFYLGGISLEAFFGPSKNNLGLNDLLFNSDEVLPAFVHFEGEILAKMDCMFREIYKEFTEKLKWNDLNVISMLTEAMIMFDRTRDTFRNHKKSSLDEYQNDNFWDILYYVHTCYMQNITLNSLANNFFINSFYISKLFKERMGINFVDFLHDIRIRHACSLLTSTEMPITDIAAEVGFNSYVTFTRVFFQRKGINASSYRKLKTP